MLQRNKLLAILVIGTVAAVMIYYRVYHVDNQKKATSCPDVQREGDTKAFAGFKGAPTNWGSPTTQAGGTFAQCQSACNQLTKNKNGKVCLGFTYDSESGKCKYYKASENSENDYPEGMMQFDPTSPNQCSYDSRPGVFGGNF